MQIVNTSYACPSGGKINAGRQALVIDSPFTDGEPAILSLASYFPDTDAAVAVTLASGSLPTGVTLDPVGKRLIYDGTPGAANASISLRGRAVAPSLRIAGGSGTVPIMAGVVFPEGLVTGPLGTNTAGVHAQIKRTWPDGTAKHAIVAGVCAATAIITFNTAPAGGSNLTATDIATAAPSASVDLGADGSVTLASLLATPFETWVSTPGMVECHYRSTLSTHANGNIYVEFQVRLWADGACWVRANIESSLQQRSAISGVVRVISGTVVIDGTTVQTYSAQNLYVGCILSHQRWVGSTQHTHTTRNNVRQLARTKLVKHYAYPATVPEAALAANTYTYTPDSIGRYTSNMPASGYQHQLGPLPLWEVQYLQSDDDRTYHAVVEHLRAAFSFPILWRVPSGGRAGRMITPTDYPTLNGLTSGAQAAGFSQLMTQHHWEQAHNPSMGYLAYLVTGDAMACDAMLANCASMFQGNDRRFGLLDVGLAADNNGVNRVDFNQQQRAQAWQTRTLGQAAALAPDDGDEGAVIRTWYENIIRYWSARSVNDPVATNSTTGMPYSWSTVDQAQPLTAGAWHYQWWADSVGFNSEAGAVSASFVGEHNAFRNWMYRGVVGILGHPSGEYCYSRAAQYYVQISDEVVANFVTRWGNALYQSWGEIWAASAARFGWPAECTTTLQGASGSDPANAATGYWGNLLPAISSAVDLGITGASEAWARLTASTNWSTVTNSFGAYISPYGYTSVWGAGPRPALASTSRSASITFAEAPPQYPAWRPAVNTVIAVTLNTLYDVRNDGGPSTDGRTASNDFKTKGQLDDWGAAVAAYDWGLYGRYVVHNGGHADSRETSIYGVDFETRLWTKIRRRTANVYARSDGNTADTVTGWYWANGTDGDPAVQEGEPFASQGYTRLLWLPESAISGVAPNGWLYRPGSGSMPDQGQAGTLSHHKIPLGLALNTPWEIHGVGTTFGSHSWALHDPVSNRVVWAYGDAGTVRYLDYLSLSDPNDKGRITWTSADGPGITPYYAFGKFDAAERLYYNIRWNSASGLWFTAYDPVANKAYNPAVTGTAPTAGEAPGDMGIEWVENYRAFVMMNYNTNKVWCLKAPANPRTGTWTWSSVMLGGQTINKPLIEQNPIYTKFRYFPKLDMLVWAAYHTLPMQGFVISPP